MASTVRASVLVLAIAGAMHACTREAGQPFAPSVPTHLAIDGPASIPPGVTRQYKASIRGAEGFIRDVTDQAVWRSSDETVVSMSGRGAAAGLRRGAAAISAAFDGRTAVKDGVMVLPDGTFRVSGTVGEAGFPIGGARSPQRAATRSQ